MTVFSFSLLTPSISSEAMLAVVDDRAKLQRMLDFEIALVRALAALGLVPALATDKVSEAAKIEKYDLAKLGEEAVRAGDIATPVVKALTDEVAKTDSAAARFVHWGASNQDLTDTTQVLELRAGIDVLLIDLGKAIDSFTALAGRHRRTASLGRTTLQHALPLPLGLKIANYANALARSRDRLRRLRKEALVLQFGGRVGTLAALGERGLQVTERLAALLDLPAPEAPWLGHSDRLAEVAAAIAIMTGSCGKIARDIALMMQTEVAEAFEPAPRVTDIASAMPHKRVPVLAATALSAATIVPNLLATIVAGQVQEHERGVGGGQAQWHTFPALLLASSSAISAIATIAQGLDVDPERMRSNLEVTHGLIMGEAVVNSLSTKLSREASEIIVEEASRKAIAEKRHLNTVLSEDPRVTAHMTPGELARLFELMNYQGSAQTFIERIVGALQARGMKRI
jgi:3-carboxy-cis,cis-muconate cycloisomerase